MACCSINATLCLSSTSRHTKFVAKGPRLLGPCGGVGGAKWLLALSGAPRRLLTEAVRGTYNTWVSYATRNFTNFPGVVRLWPTYPPTRSTMNSQSTLTSQFCAQEFLRRLMSKRGQLSRLLMLVEKRALSMLLLTVSTRLHILSQARRHSPPWKSQLCKSW